jgi:hypothetical protein
MHTGDRSRLYTDTKLLREFGGIFRHALITRPYEILPLFGCFWDGDSAVEIGCAMSFCICGLTSSGTGTLRAGTERGGNCCAAICNARKTRTSKSIFISRNAITQSPPTRRLAVVILDGVDKTGVMFGTLASSRHPGPSQELMFERIMAEYHSVDRGRGTVTADEDPAHQRRRAAYRGWIPRTVSLNTRLKPTTTCSGLRVPCPSYKTPCLRSPSAGESFR